MLRHSLKFSLKRKSSHLRPYQTERYASTETGATLSKLKELAQTSEAHISEKFPETVTAIYDKLPADVKELVVNEGAKTFKEYGIRWYSDWYILNFFKTVTPLNWLPCWIEWGMAYADPAISIGLCVVMWRVLLSRGVFETQKSNMKRRVEWQKNLRLGNINVNQTTGLVDVSKHDELARFFTMQMPEKETSLSGSSREIDTWRDDFKNLKAVRTRGLTAKIQLLQMPSKTSFEGMELKQYNQRRQQELEKANQELLILKGLWPAEKEAKMASLYQKYPKDSEKVRLALKWWMIKNTIGRNFNIFSKDNPTREYFVFIKQNTFDKMADSNKLQNFNQPSGTMASIKSLAVVGVMFNARVIGNSGYPFDSILPLPLMEFSSTALCFYWLIQTSSFYLTFSANPNEFCQNRLKLASSTATASLAICGILNHFQMPVVWMYMASVSSLCQIYFVSRSNTDFWRTRHGLLSKKENAEFLRDLEYARLVIATEYVKQGVPEEEIPESIKKFITAARLKWWERPGHFKQNISERRKTLQGTFTKKEMMEKLKPPENIVKYMEIMKIISRHEGPNEYALRQAQYAEALNKYCNDPKFADYDKFKLIQKLDELRSTGTKEEKEKVKNLLNSKKSFKIKSFLKQKDKIAAEELIKEYLDDKNKRSILMAKKRHNTRKLFPMTDELICMIERSKKDGKNQIDWKKFEKKHNLEKMFDIPVNKKPFVFK